MRNVLALLLLFALSYNALCQVGSINSLLVASDSSINNPDFWRAPYWFDAVIQKNDLAESPTALSWTIKDDDCAGIFQIGYQLALDLDGNGFIETLIDSDSLFNGDTLRYNNLNQYQGGEPRRFDFRAVAAAERWHFGKQISSIGDTLRRISLVWDNAVGGSTVPELPYGNHRIIWRFVSSCGTATAFMQTISVKDGLPPQVVCINPITASLFLGSGSSPMATFWASDPLLYATDNYFDASSLQLGIRKAGTGVGFPVESGGTVVNSLSYNCDELGNQSVELWVRDPLGATNKCVTSISVNDFSGYCNVLTSEAVLTIETEAGDCVSDVSISTSPNIVVGTGGGCGYPINFTGPVGSNDVITPTKNVDPLNGVNTFDLFLINRHILALQPINSSYRLIAADANKNGQITTFDIVEIRKLILGVYSQLPANESWRFVNAEQVFVTPTNPFAETIQESVLLENLLDDGTAGFVAIKIGDIDLDADANLLPEADVREAPLSWEVTDRMIEAGTTFSFEMQPNGTAVAAQWTLNADQLELLSVEGLHDDDYALHHDYMTMAWYGDALPTLKVTARAHKSGLLSESLRLSDELTPTVAFDANAKAREQVLRFTSTGSKALEVRQSAPNPAQNKANIDFYLPESAEVQLTLFDVTGKTVGQQNLYFDAGYQRFELRDLERYATGTVLYYRVVANGQSATRSLSIIK
jgi:hypothetical protein